MPVRHPPVRLLRVHSVGQRSMSKVRSQMIGRKVPWERVGSSSISVGRLYPPAAGSRILRRAWHGARTLLMGVSIDPGPLPFFESSETAPDLTEG